MAIARGNDDIFTNGDIESGSITENISGIREEPSIVRTQSLTMEGMVKYNGHSEDIDKWVGSLERKLEDVPQYMCSRGHPGRISRIPEILRIVDVKGYEPFVLSVGPYHNGKPRLQSLEMRKKLVLKCILENKPELTLKDYLREIMSIVPTVRSFYTEIEMDSEQFVHMLLLDSVYIVTSFCGLPKSRERVSEIITRIKRREENEEMDKEKKNKNEGPGSSHDGGNLEMTAVTDEVIQVNSGEHWFWTWFTHNLFLMENQLPFLVLQKIYDLTYVNTETKLIDIMKYSFIYMLEEYIRLDFKKVTSRSEEVHHLLHLCHMFFQPTIHQESNVSHFPETSQMFRLGSALQLYEAGVRFVARSVSTEFSVLDITFDSSGKMIMPCLHVDDNTESLLRNLIALEQMKYPSLGLNISAYVVFLLHLVTTPKDVELLRRKGIIKHHLASDKEMLYLVNRLSTGLAFDYVEDQYSLKKVFWELKYYSERRGPRWRAWLKHRHFSNLWTMISLLAASLLLLLTLVQTYYAVYSYYYPYFNGHL